MYCICVSSVIDVLLCIVTFFVNQDFLWCMMSLRGILTYSVQFGILLTSTSRAFSVEELPQSWPAAYCSFSVLLHTWSGCHVIWIVTLCYHKIRISDLNVVCHLRSVVIAFAQQLIFVLKLEKNFTLSDAFHNYTVGQSIAPFSFFCNNFVKATSVSVIFWKADTLINLQQKGNKIFHPVLTGFLILPLKRSVLQSFISIVM